MAGNSGGSIVKPRGVLEGVQLGLGDIGIVTTIFHSSKLPSQCLTDFYNMLQTGLVDCAMLWPESAATFNIFEVAPYMIRTDFGPVNSKTVTANQNYRNTLPDEVKDVLRAVSIDYRDHLAALTMDNAAAAGATYVETGGTIIEISDDDRAAWAAAMPNVAQEWAATLNGNGEDGNQMLESYLAKLEAAGFTGVRDWTQP